MKVYDLFKFNDAKEINLDVSEVALKKGEVSNWRHMGTASQTQNKVFLHPVSINKMIEIDGRNQEVIFDEVLIPDLGMPKRDFSKKEYETEPDDLREYIGFMVEGV